MKKKTLQKKLIMWSKNQVLKSRPLSGYLKMSEIYEIELDISAGELLASYIPYIAKILEKSNKSVVQFFTLL